MLVLILGAEYVQFYNIYKFSNMEMNIKLLKINKISLYFIFKVAKFQNDTWVLKIKNNVSFKIHPGNELHLKHKVWWIFNMVGCAKDVAHILLHIWL